MMRNRVILLLASLCVIAGCTSNGGYHGESLESIKGRHAEMVQGYKYGSVAQGYYDESLEREALGDSEVGGGNLFLLAIGIDKYRHLPNLEGASREARLLALTLKEDYGFKVKVLDNPTREEIFVTMGRYRNMLREDSHLIVYYAGHGLLDESTGQGYWLTGESQMDDRKEWISMIDITAFFRAMAAKDIMVIADSCYMSSPQPQSGKAMLAVDQGESGSTQKVRVVLTSGTTVPAEGEADSNRFAFMETLLDTLKNNQGPIKGAALYSAVKDRMTVLQLSSPQYGIIPESGHQGGDFVFVPLADGKGEKD